MAEKKRIY